jgi:hypothetical protein
MPTTTKKPVAKKAPPEPAPVGWTNEELQYAILMELRALREDLVTIVTKVEAKVDGANPLRGVRDLIGRWQ